MTRIRVAMVSEHASPLARVGEVDAGGQNVHVAALSSALAELGAQVTVYTRRNDAALPPRVALAPRVSVAHVDAGPALPLPKDDLHPYMADFGTVLHGAWQGDPPDIVHGHFWMSGEAGLAAARPLRIPFVQTFHALGAVKRRHQGTGDTSPPERLAVERRIVGQADRILATCGDEVRELTALGAKPCRVRVVPCGVDLSRFWPEGPSEPKRARHRILVVGRLVPRKGVRDVLAALTTLPGVELVVAGGPDRDALGRDAEAVALGEAARGLGVADRVDLRGRVPREDLPALYRSADVVVCAPWYEPFGLTPLEAMGCGVPVVATAVGGQLDTVVDEVTGLHVPPRAPAELAAAIGDLLGDPARRAAMGTAATRRARLYSWPRIAAATLTAYEEVLAGGELQQAVSQ